MLLGQPCKAGKTCKRTNKHKRTHTEIETERKRGRERKNKQQNVNQCRQRQRHRRLRRQRNCKTFLFSCCFHGAAPNTRCGTARCPLWAPVALRTKFEQIRSQKKPHTRFVCVWWGASSSARRFHNVPITAPAASPPLAMPTAAGSGLDTWGHCCPFQLEIALTNEMGKIPNWYFKQAHSVAQHQAGQRVHKTKCDSNWRSSRHGERDSHNERERESDSTRDERLLVEEIRSDANRTR